MAKKLSNFGVLMDLFNITGRELAGALHVDFTLISKWRNRTRTISPRSVHLKRIVEYFMALDSKAHFITIKKLLADSYPQLTITDESEISMFLSKWLSVGEAASEAEETPMDFAGDKRVSKGQYYIFKDNAGRRMASRKFIETALASPPGSKELLLFSQESGAWFIEDEEFLEYWRLSHLDFLNNGGKIKVIHTVDRLYKSIASSLINWLPLHLTGNTTPYFFPQFMDTPIKSTIYILRDQALIFSVTTEGLSKSLTSYLTFEQSAITQSQYVIQRLLDQSLPLFDKIPFGQPSKFLSLSVKAAKSDESNIYVAAPPCLTLISRYLLQNILQYNGVSDEQTASLIESHAAMQEYFYLSSSKKHYRYIFNTKKVEQFLDMEEVIFNRLSMLSGRRIVITQEMFRQCLQEMLIMAAKKSNIEIALIDGPLLPVLENQNLWIKENTLLSVGTTLQYADAPFSLTTSELSAVNPCYYYFNQLWNEIPQVNRDRSWVRQKLNNMIANHKFTKP